MHSPHLIQSILPGFSNILIWNLQAEAQAPQRIHLELSIDRWKKETLLKNPYIAPKGQIYRQKGRYITADTTIVAASRTSFQLYRKPAAARIELSRRTRGIPPSRVPAGQIYLQNQASPSPVISIMHIGSNMTKVTVGKANIVIKNAGETDLTKFGSVINEIAGFFK